MKNRVTELDYLLLIKALRTAEKFETRAIMLEAFIQTYGPIPKEYIKEVRGALNSEKKS